MKIEELRSVDFFHNGNEFIVTIVNGKTKEISYSRHSEESVLNLINNLINEAEQIPVFTQSDIKFAYMMGYVMGSEPDFDIKSKDRERMKKLGLL